MNTRHLASVLLAGSIAFLAAGCCQEAKSVGPHVIIADTQADTGAASTIVAPGDNFMLRLPVTTGTGYQWRTANKPSYAWSMMILDDEVETSTTAPAAGGAAWQVFKMQATQPGIQPIEFVYDRPYDPDALPAKRFTLNLEVIDTGWPWIAPGTSFAPR